ncbi:MAG: hydrogenase maturation nickel metallochaperone HypA [Lachnospiraceae bacterium]|nr:hydrogenase maturation nickel metallochaperone HypA [Lachnospiraceae bacterium]
MHEISFIAGIMDTILAEAEKKGLTNITGAKISVGAMTGALPEYLEMYFREASKGTILENTVLDINIVPVAAECSYCKNIYEPDRANGYLCPACKSGSGRIVRGRDIVVDSLLCD